MTIERQSEEISQLKYKINSQKGEIQYKENDRIKIEELLRLKTEELDQEMESKR